MKPHFFWPNQRSARISLMSIVALAAVSSAPVAHFYCVTIFLMHNCHVQENEQEFIFQVNQ